MSRKEGRGSFHLSKSLSWLLRHGAKKEGLHIADDGFTYVEDVLNHKLFKGYTESQIRDVVDSNEKQRFALQTCSKTGKLQIRANQGHSFPVNNLELQPILSRVDAPVIVHGTSLRHWHSIEKEGLCRMKRIHIHFAAGETESNEVISGFRSSSEVLIYIDVEKALADGIKFFRSTNNVILSSGDERGYLKPTYFKNIKFLRSQ